MYIYIASVVLLKLHGCVVSHMQVLATTLLSVHNYYYTTHFAGLLQLKEFYFSYLFLPVCASEQGNVIGSVRIYIYICVQKKVVMSELGI